MEYSYLEQHVLQSPAVKLLRSPHAALIVSFLYEQFHREPKPSLRLVDLRDALSLYLDQINEHEPNRYPGTSEYYLNQWTNEGQWLRIVRSDAAEEHIVELTVHTQRVVGWMEELQQRTFVGTESRFLQILNLIEQLVVRGTSDKQVRLDQLYKERERIDKEIRQIEDTGQVEQFDSRQIRERFSYINMLASQLLRDFSAVEEAFKEIAQQVQSSQVQPDIRKGIILQNVLDADQELHDSDVGKSFYAFWSYLNLPGHQESLDQRIDSIFRLEDISPEEKRSTILRGLIGHLISAGLKVNQSNQRLAEQLRRMLDEAHIEESRRVKSLIQEIKAIASHVQDQVDDREILMILEGIPQTHLTMEHELYYPGAVIRYDEPVPFDEADDALDVTALMDYFYIDTGKLRDRIEALLEKYYSFTLSDLLNEYRCEKGLAEIVTYLQIAADSDVHQIDSTHEEVIVVPSSHLEYSPLRLKVPKVVFKRFREVAQ